MRSKGLLPQDGERVAGRGLRDVLVHGTGLRVASGVHRQGRDGRLRGLQDPSGRHYDRLLAITRSGTTTEVLRLLHQRRGRQPTLAVTGDPVSAVLEAADQTIVLDFADEQSVVQTRFATTTLALSGRALVRTRARRRGGRAGPPRSPSRPA